MNNKERRRFLKKPPEYIQIFQDADDERDALIKEYEGMSMEEIFEKQNHVKKRPYVPKTAWWSDVIWSGILLVSALSVAISTTGHWKFLGILGSIIWGAIFVRSLNKS